MPPREARWPKQPPFFLLDHNAQSDVAERLQGLARFRQVGEREKERRFRRDARDLAIHQGQRRFLFVTNDRDFLRPPRLPNKHGGVLVLVCPLSAAAEALPAFLDRWGPKRNLLRNRQFRLTGSGGVEVRRDGSLRRIYRQPGDGGADAYGAG